MTFQRNIVKELHCPRCNAIAQLRITDEHDDSCICYIVCSKCKLRKYYGVLSKKTVMMIVFEQKLLDKIKYCVSESEKLILEQKLDIIRKKIDLASSGLGG